LFRATAITALLDAGTPLAEVQKWADHVRPETTEGYWLRANAVKREAALTNDLVRDARQDRRGARRMTGAEWDWGQRAPCYSVADHQVQERHDRDKRAEGDPGWWIGDCQRRASASSEDDHKGPQRQEFLARLGLPRLVALCPTVRASYSHGRSLLRREQVERVARRYGT